MSTPQQPDESLAEKVARVWHEHVAHVPWEQATGKDRVIALAEERLRAFRAAGLAVVELPVPGHSLDGDLLWEGDSHDVRIGASVPRLAATPAVAIERGQDVIGAAEARELAGMLLAAAARLGLDGGDPR